MSEKSIGSESNAGSESSLKSYAQVVGVPEKRFPNFGSYGSPLHLQTQLSSSSGGATTPISISSSSSCHDLFKPDGIPILNSSEIKRRLKKVRDILIAKRGDADHYENKATEWKTQLKLEPNADQKLIQFQKELNNAVDKIKYLNEQKKRAQSDVTDVVNRLTDWQNRNPDCRTGHKLEHLENKCVKLQKDIDLIKEKLDNFNKDYDNVGRKLKENQKSSIAAQDKRLVTNIRICKDKLSTLSKKKEELSGFAKKLKDLSETISKFDNQIKEWQPKVDELTKKSTPLKNAIDTRDRLDRLKSDIKKYEEELSALNERSDHLKEQRKLARLSLQSSNQGATNKYHFTSGNKPTGHSNSHTKDLSNNAHMLLTALRGLPSDQTKRKVVHPDVLKLLHEFDLSAMFMEDGGLETCINFLEKYVNQPPLRLPAPVAGPSSTTPTGTLVGSRTEDSDSVFAESGYNSVSCEKQANQQTGNANGVAHDEVSSNQNTAASSIVQLEAMGTGFESSSNVPRTSIAEEEEEEEEEALKETFSQTLFRRQQSAESSLRQIPSHSTTRSLYVSEWMATKTGRDDPRSFTHTSSAVDINLEDRNEYPPLSTAVQLMQINPELADSDEKLDSVEAGIIANQ